MDCSFKERQIIYLRWCYGLFTMHRVGDSTGDGTATIGNNGPGPCLCLKPMSHCEHFNIVLYIPFGPCTSPGPVPVWCEYTIIRRQQQKKKIKPIDCLHCRSCSTALGA